MAVSDLSTTVFLFTVYLTVLHYSHIHHMVFSVSFSRATFILLQVSSLLLIINFSFTIPCVYQIPLNPFFLNMCHKYFKCLFLILCISILFHFSYLKPSTLTRLMCSYWFLGDRSPEFFKTVHTIATLPKLGKDSPLSCGWITLLRPGIVPGWYT